uniref:Putative secreted peptide n=1 Tax=Anopheles braziliensis TaxID=58242 RepID=A0A2M3ZT53_9DIPT
MHEIPAPFPPFLITLSLCLLLQSNSSSQSTTNTNSMGPIVSISFLTTFTQVTASNRIACHRARHLRRRWPFFVPSLLYRHRPNIVLA